MRALTLVTLIAAGAAMLPISADARPRNAVIEEAEVQAGDDLNEFLRREGWTILNLPSNMHAPGKLFKPGSTSPMGTCVDAEPVTGELPSIESQGSKGFVVEASANKGIVNASGGVKAKSFKLKSTTNVQHSVIEGFGMELNATCVAKLRAARARGEPVDEWFVIQEVAEATVQEVMCSSKEAAADVQARWLAKVDVGAMSDCVQSTNGTGVIAYKSRPVSELRPAESTAVMIPAAAIAPGTAAPASASANVSFGASGAGINVAERLRQQQCEEQAKTGGTRARSDRLNAAVAEVQRQAHVSWLELEPDLEMCARLTRPERIPCIVAANEWLDAARSMTVTIAAGVEPVQTDCGERQPAYPEQSKTVTGSDLPRAEALLGLLERDPAAARAAQEDNAPTKPMSEEAARAVQVHQKDCDRGKAEDCHYLGWMYHSGEGIPRDYSMAASLYKKACDAGSAAACVDLGVMFYTGKGVSRSDTRSVRLYQQACDARHPAGCTHLGFMYYNGEGIARDYTTAAALYSKACKWGDAPACGNLGLAYKSGRGVKMNAQAAQKYSQKACDMGHAKSCDGS